MIWHHFKRAQHIIARFCWRNFTTLRNSKPTQVRYVLCLQVYVKPFEKTIQIQRLTCVHKDLSHFLLMAQSKCRTLHARGKRCCRIVYKLLCPIFMFANCLSRSIPHISCWYILLTYYYNCFHHNIFNLYPVNTAITFQNTFLFIIIIVLFIIHWCLHNIILYILYLFIYYIYLFKYFNL